MNVNQLALLQQLAGEPLVNRESAAVVPDFARAPKVIPPTSAAIAAPKQGGMSKGEKITLAIMAALAGVGGVMAAKDRSFGGAAAFAAGGADALSEIEETRHRRGLELSRERMAREQFDYNRNQADYNRQRQTANDEFNQKRLAENDAALRAQREAQAAKDRADTEARAGRLRAIQGFITDPSSLTALPPIGRLLALNQHGVTNIGVHDVESPEEHGAHLKGEKDSAFTDWQRRADYSEQQRRSRPERPTGRLVAVDPTLPTTPQLYALEIARKHQGDFAAAQAEAMEYLSNPQTRTDHPKLSPQKFMDAVRRGMSRPGGETDVDRMMAAAGERESKQGKQGQQSKPTAATGRGANPSQGGTQALYKWSDGSTRAYPQPQGGAAPRSTPAAAPNGPVKMVAPDGRELMVPADKVEEAKRRGAKVAGGR